MTIRTREDENFTRLAKTLADLETVREFHISPSGD
jgi:hypothetical protein